MRNAVAGRSARARCACRYFLLALAVLTSGAQAHEVRPGYLQIEEVAADSYKLLWKVPARGDLRLGIYVRMPEHCDGHLEQASQSGGALVEHWQFSCPGGLAGETIQIDGLDATRTDVLVRVTRASGSTETLRLTPSQTRFAVAEAATREQVAWTYLVLGLEHILRGIDHLLFVLGLMFLVDNWRRLVLTVTAFTIAHSVTLGAASLGFIRFPQAPVEATIALSVMFVAGEVLRGARGHAGLAARAPWIVALLFGLLHGFGFAGALQEIGLPNGAIPLALLLFNIGVEAGQLLFIVTALAVVGLLKRAIGVIKGAKDGRLNVEHVIRKPAGYLIGTLSAFWVIQRIAAFVG